jgi:RHS repeat-associated protein
VSVTLPGNQTTTYKYDGTGHRLSVTGSDGVERRCLPMPATPFRLDDCAVTYGTDPTAEAPEAVVFGPVGVLSRHGQPGARYAWSALEDSVVGITDPAGAVVGTRAYDAWGNVTQTTGEPFDYGFAGERQDASSGLVFLRARYYDPATGRFLTADRADADNEDPRHLHRYAYAINDPLNRVDPAGEQDSLVGLLTGISISETLDSIEAGAKLCLKQAAQNKIKSLFTELGAHLLEDALKPIFEQAAGLLDGTFAKEKDFHATIAKILCHWDSFPLLMLGLDDKWEFEYKVDWCGKSVNRKTGSRAGTPSYKDCASGSFQPHNGIDIVYGGKLGGELKIDKKEAAGARGQKQVVRYCRFGARKGTHLFFYFYASFPDDAFHVQMAKRCWSAWNQLPGGPPVCPRSKRLGSMYFAFGAKANTASKKRSFFPKFDKDCASVLGN